MKLLTAFFLLFTPFLNATFETPEETIEMLVNGNYHLENGLKCANLFEVDPTFFNEIKQEVLHLINTNQPSLVNEKKHVTNWTKPWGMATQYSLLNTSGNYQDFSVDHNHSTKHKKFHQSTTYPHLAEFISYFPHATNFRINVMHPLSGLSQHRENCCIIHPRTKTPFLRARFHLPIQTNPSTLMYVHEELHHFKEGYIYFFHNGMTHAAENNDPDNSRVHLVWDMLLTEKTYKDMFKRNPNHFTTLHPTQKTTLTPLAYREEDPNYPYLERIPLSQARQIQLIKAH